MAMIRSCLLLMCAACVSAGLLGGWAAEAAKLRTCIGDAVASGAQRFNEKAAKHPRHPAVLGWAALQRAGAAAGALSRTYTQALGVAAREGEGRRGAGARPAKRARARRTAAAQADADMHADAEHCEALGVGRGATADELKRAFRRRSLAACPEYACDEAVIEKLQRAYEALSGDGA